MNTMPSLSRTPSGSDDNIMWQQYAATASTKRSQCSLLDDEDDDDMDNSVQNHMQLNPSNNMMPPASSFGGFPGMHKLQTAQSGALPMVTLRRSTQS